MQKSKNLFLKLELKIENRQKLRISMKLELQFSSDIEKKSIMKALQPDNINFPHGLVLEMHDNNDLMIIEIESSKIETLTNTIDEILQHISIAREVIND